MKTEIYKEMYQRVDEVLYYIWDPIGYLTNLLHEANTGIMCRIFWDWYFLTMIRLPLPNDWSKSCVIGWH